MASWILSAHSEKQGVTVTLDACASLTRTPKDLTKAIRERTFSLSPVAPISKPETHTQATV